MAGLEPADEGVKVPCLTAWLHPHEKDGTVLKISPLSLRFQLHRLNVSKIGSVGGI